MAGLMGDFLAFFPNPPEVYSHLCKAPRNAVDSRRQEGQVDVPLLMKGDEGLGVALDRRRGFDFKHLLLGHGEGHKHVFVQNFESEGASGRATVTFDV